MPRAYQGDDLFVGAREPPLTLRHHHRLELCDTYGPGDTWRKLIPLMLEAERTGKPMAMVPAETLIDLVHVDDAVEAFAVGGKRAATLTHRLDGSLDARSRASRMDSARCHGAGPVRAMTYWTIGTSSEWRPIVVNLAAGSAWSSWSCRARMTFGWSVPVTDSSARNSSSNSFSLGVPAVA
jgi:hypothetical protein